MIIDFLFRSPSSKFVHLIEMNVLLNWRCWFRNKLSALDRMSRHVNMIISLLFESYSLAFVYLIGLNVLLNWSGLNRYWLRSKLSKKWIFLLPTCWLACLSNWSLISLSTCIQALTVPLVLVVCPPNCYWTQLVEIDEILKLDLELGLKQTDWDESLSD